jgi:MFS family permease
LLADEDLVAANSAFSLAYQGVNAVANAVSGVLLALVGGIALFALDAVTFLMAALLFSSVRIPAAESATTARTSSDAPEESSDESSERDTPTPDGGKETSGYLTSLRSGLRIVRRSFLAEIIIGAVIANLTLGVALAAMPAYADVIKGASIFGLLNKASAYGVLMAAFAAGNFLGAIAASRFDDRPLGRLLIASYVLSGVTWTLAVSIDWLPATALLLVLTFIPVGIANTQISATVQAALPKDLVGRVSSVLGSATAVAYPLGSLAGGAIAGQFSPQAAMYLGAAGTATFGLYALARPSLRKLPIANEISFDHGVVNQ